MVKLADKRRDTLVVPYSGSKPLKNEMSSMLTSSLPLAAMFLRNKILSWAAFFTTVQAWLNEPANIKSDAQPAGLSVILSMVGIITCYVDIIMPPRIPTSAAKAAVEATVTAVADAITTAASS